MTTVFSVAAGGALGAVLRYMSALVFPFPYGTLAVNVVGSLAMGLTFVLLADKGLDRWQPLLLTGVLGGFTTFSAFSLDTLKLWEAGQWGGAGAYVLASVGASILGCAAGLALGRLL